MSKQYTQLAELSPPKLTLDSDSAPSKIAQVRLVSGETKSFEVGGETTAKDLKEEVRMFGI